MPNLDASMNQQSEEESVKHSKFENHGYLSEMNAKE
jgi:hypothetical protein